MMSLLEHYGIAADMLVGTSSGGMAACYYATGDMRRGATVFRYVGRKGYERDGRSRRLVDLRRLICRKTGGYVFVVQALAWGLRRDCWAIAAGPNP
jgi:hypothetical protein